jgi:hypothetical protein
LQSTVGGPRRSDGVGSSSAVDLLDRDKLFDLMDGR